MPTCSISPAAPSTAISSAQGSSDTINFAPSGFLGTFTYAAPYGFTGINQVNINSGFVVLNGNDDATNIDVNGGALFGTGTLDPLAVTIHSGGTLAPGGIGTPGTMTINGNLVFLSGATYLVHRRRRRVARRRQRHRDACRDCFGGSPAGRNHRAPIHDFAFRGARRHDL